MNKKTLMSMLACFMLASTNLLFTSCGGDDDDILTDVNPEKQQEDTQTWDWGEITKLKWGWVWEETHSSGPNDIILRLFTQQPLSWFDFAVRYKGMIIDITIYGQELDTFGLIPDGTYDNYSIMAYYVPLNSDGYKGYNGGGSAFIQKHASSSLNISLTESGFRVNVDNITFLKTDNTFVLGEWNDQHYETHIDNIVYISQAPNPETEEI